MSTSKTLAGFMAGAMVGLVAGILFAPDKGSNTRQKIASKTGDLTDSVKESFGEFIDKLKESYGGIKKDVEQFGQNAESTLKSTSHDVKRSLSQDSFNMPS